MKEMLDAFKKNLITGLVILLPIAVTFALLSFLIDLFTAPFVDLVSAFLMRFNIRPTGFLFLSSAEVVRYISKILILGLLFGITVILGFITRWFVVNFLLSLTDNILKRIPVINTVYKASQEILKTVFKTDQTSFKQVVMVPFPRNDCFALGLVSRQAPQKCSDLAHAPLISVLIPTALNPTSGFLLMVEQKSLTYLDMQPEDAIKYVISVGVLTPEFGNKT